VNGTHIVLRVHELVGKDEYVLPCRPISDRCLYINRPISSSSSLMEMTMSIRMVITSQCPRTLKDVHVAF